MSDIEPLKALDFQPTADGKFLIWKMLTTQGDQLQYASPTQSLAAIVRALVKICVHPKIAQHVTPLPIPTDDKMEVGESLIPNSVVAIVVPDRANVGLEINLPGGIRMILEFPKEYAKELASNLSRAASEVEASRGP